MSAEQQPPRGPGQYTEQQRAAVGATISAHLREFGKRGGGGKRHPAAVTADRLGDNLTTYGADLDGADRDAFARVRHILNSWADGTPL